MLGLLLILTRRFLLCVYDTLVFGGCSHKSIIHLLADVPEDVHWLFQGLSSHGVFLYSDDRDGIVGMQVRLMRIPEDKWAPSHIGFVGEAYWRYLTCLGWLIVHRVTQKAGQTRLTPCTWSHMKVIVSICISLGMSSIQPMNWQLKLFLSWLMHWYRVML